MGLAMAVTILMSGGDPSLQGRTVRTWTGSAQWIQAGILSPYPRQRCGRKFLL